MKGMKTAGIVLVIAGLIILILFLLADVIGMGSSAGFGRNQIVGALVGVVVAVLGLVLALRRQSATEIGDPSTKF